MGDPNAPLMAEVKNLLSDLGPRAEVLGPRSSAPGTFPSEGRGGGGGEGKL